MEEFLFQALMYNHLHVDVNTVYNTEMINNVKIKKSSYIMRCILQLKWSNLIQMILQIKSFHPLGGLVLIHNHIYETNASYY